MKNNTNAPTYQFKPLKHHIDGGFGALGESFYEAGVQLEKITKSKSFQNSLIPIAYLYRHAVELFLKSSIIVIHRGLNISFGINEPSIKVGNKWILIKREHSIKNLFLYLNALLSEHINILNETTSTDWQTIPKDINEWIIEIDEFDKRSTFFRYPGEGDEIKSEFRESSIPEIFSSMAPNKKPLKAFLEFNENDQITGSFCLDLSRIESIKHILHKTAEILSTLHFALRCELSKGS